MDGKNGCGRADRENLQDPTLLKSLSQLKMTKVRKVARNNHGANQTQQHDQQAGQAFSQDEFSALLNKESARKPIVREVDFLHETQSLRSVCQ